MSEKGNYPSEVEVRKHATKEGLVLVLPTFLGASWAGEIASGRMTSEAYQSAVSIDSGTAIEEYPIDSTLDILSIGVFPMIAAVAVYKVVKKSIIKRGGSPFIGYNPAMNVARDIND